MPMSHATALNESRGQLSRPWHMHPLPPPCPGRTTMARATNPCTASRKIARSMPRAKKRAHTTKSSPAWCAAASSRWTAAVRSMPFMFPAMYSASKPGASTADRPKRSAIAPSCPIVAKVWRLWRPRMSGWPSGSSPTPCAACACAGPFPGPRAPQRRAKARRLPARNLRPHAARRGHRTGNDTPGYCRLPRAHHRNRVAHPVPVRAQCRHRDPVHKAHSPERPRVASRAQFLEQDGFW